MMRALGLLTLWAAVVLALTSFRPVPDASAFVVPYGPFYPLREIERPRPLPYSMPIVLQWFVWVVRYCDETGVPVWLACRLFAHESSASGDPLDGRWNPNATNWLGASGLAQIMPINLGLFAIKYNNGVPVDPFDPETAIRCGIRYLADLFAMSGSWQTALRSYNGGAGHWTDPRHWGAWPEESLAYSRVILGGER
jgi:Transglycosylase SLT domain